MNHFKIKSVSFFFVVVFGLLLRLKLYLKLSMNIKSHISIKYTQIMKIIELSCPIHNKNYEALYCFTLV